MILKKAKYKKVKVWQNKLVTSEVHGCDCCKKVIKEWPNEQRRLDMTVWHKRDDSDTRHYHFCSWKCVFDFIKTVKCEYFISLPHLSFEDVSDKKTSKEFINLIKRIK
jgi:hypothetical protein